MKIKLIHGTLWLICPKCGKKLHPITADAECHGVGTSCKKCGWNGFININGKKERKEEKQWQVLRSAKPRKESITR